MTNIMHAELPVSQIGWLILGPVHQVSLYRRLFRTFMFTGEYFLILPRDVSHRDGFSFYECASSWDSRLFMRFYLFIIRVDYLREYIILCTHNIRFCFEGNAYRQIDRVTMGSPLGPTLTDVCLFIMETKIHDCISETVLYKQSVDDVLHFTESTNVNILKLFNSPHFKLSVILWRRSKTLF